MAEQYLAGLSSAIKKCEETTKIMNNAHAECLNKPSDDGLESSISMLQGINEHYEVVHKLARELLLSTEVIVMIRELMVDSVAYNIDAPTAVLRGSLRSSEAAGSRNRLLLFEIAMKVDVTDLIEGHSSYLTASQGILQRLELETYYPVFVTPTVDSSELIVQLN